MVAVDARAKVPGTTGNTYTGPIIVSSGSAVQHGSSSGTTTPAGTGRSTFTDANNGFIDYKVHAGVDDTVDVIQHKTIARYDLGTGPQPTCTYSATADPVAATNYQDLWWVPAESGWGINFTHQGDSIFADLVHHRRRRHAACGCRHCSGAWERAHPYKGDLLRTSGPRFDNYKASDIKPNQTVGKATVTFADGNHATFDYDITAGLPVTSQMQADHALPVRRRPAPSASSPRPAARRRQPRPAAALPRTVPSAAIAM